MMLRPFNLGGGALEWVGWGEGRVECILRNSDYVRSMCYKYWWLCCSDRMYVVSVDSAHVRIGSPYLSGVTRPVSAFPAAKMLTKNSDPTHGNVFGLYFTPWAT